MRLSENDLDFLLGLFEKEDWHEVKGPRVKRLLKRGLLERRVTMTTEKFYSSRGRLLKTKKTMVSEYRLAREILKKISTLHQKRAEEAEMKRASDWERKTRGVPADVVRRGEVAVTIWKNEGRKAPRWEIDQIERDLGGGHS